MIAIVSRIVRPSRVTEARLSATETELSRTAHRWAVDHDLLVDLRVREIGGVLVLQTMHEGGVIDSRPLGQGKEIARTELAIALWDLVSWLDTETEADPIEPPSLSLAAVAERVVVAVAAVATVAIWWLAVLC